MTKDKLIEIMYRLDKLEIANRSSASDIIGLEDDAHERILDINEIDEELETLKKDLTTETHFLYTKFTREVEGIETNIKDESTLRRDCNELLSSRLNNQDKRLDSFFLTNLVFGILFAINIMADIIWLARH